MRVDLSVRQQDCLKNYKRISMKLYERCVTDMAVI